MIRNNLKSLSPESNIETSQVPLQKSKLVSKRQLWPFLLQKANSISPRQSQKKAVVGAKTLRGWGSRIKYGFPIRKYKSTPGQHNWTAQKFDPS